MKKADIPVVKRSLFSWVFAGNVKLQITLLFIIVVMVFARVVPLEMQKRIVNEAINLRSIDLLLMYCGIYLVAVIFFSALKYLTNVIQTLITQRTTARMRKELYHHILTLPLGFFRNAAGICRLPFYSESFAGGRIIEYLPHRRFPGPGAPERGQPRQQTAGRCGPAAIQPYRRVHYGHSRDPRQRCLPHRKSKI
jgi:hypothetical protein